MTITNNISKPIPNAFYSWIGRFSKSKDAKDLAISRNGVKHAYYLRVRVKGDTYFDVREQD